MLPCHCKRRRMEQRWHSSSRSSSSRCSAAILVALLVLARAAAPVDAAQCTTYTPTGGGEGVPAGCFFKLYNTKNVKQPSPIKKGIKFHMSEIDCAYYESGVFDTESVSGECPDPFMTEGERPLPTCSDSCCEADLPGSWHVDEADPLVRHFQPDGGQCEYFAYRRGELLRHLQANDADILVAGDSMMRQIFSRLVQMMRGQRRILDYQHHLHASYQICSEADMYRTEKMVPHSHDSKLLYRNIPEFFWPEGAAAAAPMDRCSGAPVSIHFLWAPLFSQHGDRVRRYLAHRNSSRPLVVVANVLYHNVARNVPPGYKAYLKKVAPEVASYYIPSIPRQRVPNKNKSASFANRNAVMSEFAREAGPPFRSLDFDQMSRAPGAPGGCADNNWHYMCFLYLGHRMMEELNFFRDPHFAVPLEAIWPDEQGECTDEMNRNIWQRILGSLMKEPIRTFQISDEAEES